MEPDIMIEGAGSERYVTVLVKLRGPLAREFVSARFQDPERPDETNRAARERLIARARDLMRQIGSQA